MEINYLNLKKMFNYVLENVQENMIKMMTYRAEQNDTHKCNSTGCVIGHCIILDEWENIPKNPFGNINFEHWSEKFTGLNGTKWKWCFGQFWPNDKEQILLRLKYLIDNQKIPYNWYCDFGYKLPVKKLELYKI